MTFNLLASRKKSPCNIALSTSTVLIRSKSGQWFSARAFFDSASLSSYMTEHIANQLPLQKTNVHIQKDLGGKNMPIVRSATTTIASQTKVHIQKDLGGRNMSIDRSATTTIASQIKIESPLAFGPSDHQPFIGILRLLESSQYRNQLSIGATLIEMVFLDGSSPAMSRFKHVQFIRPLVVNVHKQQSTSSQLFEQML